MFGMKSIKTEVSLATGSLVVNTNDDITELSGFASRSNKKRGFLFLSKVLGKHFPSCPYLMASVHKRLANLIRPLLKDGPTVVIGFSETATGLGYGIYAALNLPDSYYQHSTRHKIDRPLFLAFSENHSHASSHYFYLPEKDEHSKFLKHAVNIVFVDDEYTTGNTLLNIISAFQEKGVNANFIAASILDWTPKDTTSLLPDIVSLVKGTFHFEEKPLADFQEFVSEPQLPVVHQGLINSYGRMGCEVLSIEFKSKISDLPHINDRVLVLGTGEFMNVAYLLGIYLKSFSENVFVQSTTRSPILIGNDVKSVLRFKDNYAEQVDNFLYNVEDSQYDHVFICYETSGYPADHDLYLQLKKIFPRVTQLFF